MKFISLNTSEPEYNLAAEEHFFIKCSQPVFMLWQNDNAVIVGRNQNTAEEINQEAVKRNNVHVVRRITGGGAVYHDMGNINYSFIYPSEKTDSIEFRKFASPIINFLKTLGISAEFSGRNDILIDNRKISGTAQYCRNGKILHHGTLLFSSDLDMISNVLSVNQDKIASKSIKSVRSRVTTIQEHLDKKISVDEFRQKLTEYICDTYAPTVYELTESDEEEILNLKRSKYDTWEWNYGYSPKYTFFKRTYTSCGTIEVHLDIADGIIRNARIFGDFFTTRPISELESALTGIRHRENDLLTLFSTIGINDFFRGMTPDELPACFL